MVRPLTERIERPSAETTPAVTVDSKPSGLPIAITSWPRLQGLGVAERGIGQVAHAVGAEQRQIGVGIDAEYAGLTDVTPSTSRRPDLPGGTDHVAVGEHKPVRRDHDAGAQPAALASRSASFGPVSTRTTAGPTRSVTSMTALE